MTNRNETESHFEQNRNETELFLGPGMRPNYILVKIGSWTERFLAPRNVTESANYESE
jgi:hypothetical protein